MNFTQTVVLEQASLLLSLAATLVLRRAALDRANMTAGALGIAQA
jgi:hypothetical protein